MSQLLIICSDQPFEGAFPAFDDANSLMMSLIEDSADGPAALRTFRAPTWQDAAGHGYAFIVMAQAVPFLAKLARVPSRPDWDADDLINLTGARRAYDARVIWDGTGLVPQVQPAQMVFATIAGGPFEAMAAMGLTQMEIDL